jgi:hypothetical protein
MIMSLSLLALTVAFAQEPVTPPATVESGADEVEDETDGYEDRYTPGEEFVVVGDLVVQAARHEVTRALAQQGYVAKRQREGFTVYLHPVAYKPKVLVYDDGFVIIRRRGVAYTPPNVGNVSRGLEIGLRTATCVVAPIFCFHAPGLLMSPARLEKQKEMVVEGLEDEVRAYNDALAARAMGGRLEQVADLLDAIWLTGQQTDTGERLATPVQRRQALMVFWETRADNEYGDAVRRMVEDFMNYEVQPSPWPFETDEITALNVRRTCKRALVLLPPG